MSLWRSPRLFVSPARRPLLSFQTWVALDFSVFNRNICLIVRIKIWRHQTYAMEDLLNPGNELLTRRNNGAGWWGPYVNGVTLRSASHYPSLLNQTPGDGGEINVLRRQRSAPFFSTWKIGGNKFNGSIKTQQCVYCPWTWRTKQYCRLARVGALNPGGSLTMCFIITHVMLYCSHIVSRQRLMEH